jgi:aminoglycoside phosphotransferase (APT) family kinase protein
MTQAATTPRALADLIEEAGGRTACLAMSKDPNAKVTILIFPPGARQPELVAKVPTTDDAARDVEREAGLLAAIARRGLGPVAATVPRIVAMAEHLGRPVMVTTALPGQAMLAAYHAWRHTARPARVAADFAAAGSWLTALHHATAAGEISLASTLDGVPGVIGRRFGERPGTQDDLASLAGLQDRLAGHRTAATVVHGDLWAGNLLLAGGQVSGVVDWERAQDCGPPTRDLARFALSYSLYLDRHTRPGRRVTGHPGLRAGGWGAGVEYAMNGSGWYPRLAQQFMTEALGAIGIAGSCWRDLLLAELAAIAAEADHADFAWQHLLLFRRLSRGSRPCP